MQVADQPSEKKERGGLPLIYLQPYYLQESSTLFGDFAKLNEASY
jgi:hypothetical protein